MCGNCEHLRILLSSANAVHESQAVSRLRAISRAAVLQRTAVLYTLSPGPPCCWHWYLRHRLNLHPAADQIFNPTSEPLHWPYPTPAALLSEYGIASASEIWWQLRVPGSIYAI